MALDITRGLFGIEVPESSDQDFKDAVTFAQLSPEQSVRASGMMSGTMLGRGLGNLARAGIGYATGEDVRTPEEKRQSAKARVLQTIKEQGINPEDPMAYLPVIAKAFQEEGLIEDALKVSTVLNETKMAREKWSVESQVKSADIAAKVANAAKDQAEAANKPFAWLQNGMANGIIDPKSVKKFIESKDFNDLKFRGKYDATADIIGADGKLYRVAYNKDDPTDMHMLGETESRHADPTKTTTAKVNIVNGLLTKYGYKEGADVGEVLKKMKEGNASDYNMYVANAKDLVGADNLDEMLRTGVFKVTEEERKTLLQAEAGYRAVKDFKNMWSGKQPPIKRADMSAAVSEVEATTETKDIPANVALRKIEDVAVRNYIIAIAKMAYPRLRLETGAAISATEWANVLRNILPYADDPPELKEQKIRTAFDQNKALYVMATQTSKAAPNVFKALFPGEDIAEMFKYNLSKDATPDSGDIVSKAKAAHDSGKWPQFYRSLSAADKQALIKAGVIDK